MILQSCPACERQYDVAHLEPGDRVRCQCGSLFSVGQARALRARALLCSNCGGRLGKDEEECGYCGAAIPKAERSSSLCPRCFERMSAEAKHCPACGVEIRAQALAALPEGSGCPRCASALCVRSLGETSVVECTACQGLWISRADFEGICRRAREDADALPDPRGAEEAVRASEPERRVTYIPCPTCGERMNRRMFRYRELPSRVVIDLCREHGIWFDHEELFRVLAFVRSRANLDLPTPPPGTLERRPYRSTSSGFPVSALGRRASGGNLIGALILGEALGDLFGGVLGGLFD